MVKYSDETLQLLLQEELIFLDKAISTLQKSIVKCESIFPKDVYTFEEMESFDSLTSKFGRTSDLFTQKIIRTIWMLLHEPFVPFIDQMNIAEKMNIIDSADQMIGIRDLRNQISHEYIPEALTDILPEVMEACHELIKNIETTLSFIKQRGWILNK